MARKKQSYRPYQRRANADKTGFARLFYDLLDDPAFRDLTPRQRLLYVYCVRESHNDNTMTEGKPFDESLFLMNRAKRKEHGVYGATDTRQFERDMSELIRHGFVDAVSSGYATKKPNIYRLSARWHNWGTPSFSMPESAMSTHMLIERSKQDE